MLLTVAQFRAIVPASQSDAEIAEVIADEESELLRRLGPHGDGVTPITLTVVGRGGDLFLPRAVVSVTSVGGTTTGLTVYGAEGRVTGCWSGPQTVVAVPVDDRPQRRRALINLVRLALHRTAMRAESVAGEHSYTAPDWEADRAAIYRRLIMAGS